MNCPHCHRLLYSRQHKTCGFCGEALPPEVLFSEDEIAAIKAEQEAMAARRAVEKEKEEEDRKKAQRSRARSNTSFYFPPMS